jgi:hypothetical protein
MERDGDEEKKLEAEGENEDEESLDDETRDSLLALFAETQKRINERAMTLRCVKKEQKREQYWQVSHTDLYSDDDDDGEDDNSADDDDHDGTNAGVRPDAALYTYIQLTDCEHYRAREDCCSSRPC